MSENYKNEWLGRSEVDHFSPFISLWLACNSWYTWCYSDLNDSNSGNRYTPDRKFIDKIKEDTTGNNDLYIKFKELIEKLDKNGISFRADIELLHYALVAAELRLDEKNHLSFESTLIDYDDKDNPVNLILDRNKSDEESIELDRICIINNLQHCFAGIFEIIYQVRCMLIHGQLKPDKKEHDVVKYCYRILWALMKGNREG